MSGGIHRAILLPSLCCLAFYGGAQVVGETEAAFSSQVSPESITMSAAFVFPATIHQIEDRALKAAKSMNNHFKNITAASPGASTEDLHRKLAEVTTIEQELTLQLEVLREMHHELSAYDREIQNQSVEDGQTFVYIREGFQHVDRILSDVEATIDFSHIEAIRSSVQLQIQESEETDEPSMENTPSNQPGENAESQDESSTNETNDKQVNKDGEETVDHSE
jgi:hypothetical protein